MSDGFGWIGRCEHRAAVMLLAELGDSQRDRERTANHVAKGIKQGLNMERVPFETLLATPIGCPLCREHQAAIAAKKAR